MLHDVSDGLVPEKWLSTSREASSPRLAPPRFAPARRKRSLRASLGWLLFAVFVPLVLAGGAFLSQQYALQREQALARLADRARDLRLAVDRELALDRYLLETLAASREIDRGDWATFHAVATDASRVRPGSWIVLVDESGQNVVNTRVPFGTPLPNFRASRGTSGEIEWQGRTLPLFDARLLDVPFQTGKPAYSDLLYGLVSREPVLSRAVPVFRDGAVRYVLAFTYAPGGVAPVLGESDTDSPLVRTIMDGRGLVIARSRNGADMVGRRAPAPFDRGNAGLEAEGTGVTIGFDRVPVFYAYSRSAVADWTVAVGLPQSVVLAPARRALHAWLGVLAAAAALGALFAWRLWRGIGVPLAVLAHRARSLGSDSERMPASSIEEVDALGRALDDASHAERARLESERAREQAQARLREAHERLIEADRRKDEFLAMLSHELRNPMAAISNAVAVLGLTQGTPPTVRAMHDILQRQARQLARLVDDLLDVSRITQGKIELRRTRVSLDALVRSVAEAASANMSARGLRFTVHAEEAIMVEGDGARLTQVFGNLLDNAAKYSEPGGWVAITATREDGAAVVRVVDGGLGIEAELLPHVFDLFRQGARSLDRAQGGLGIGLTLVRSLVELHGGIIEARSEGAGRGSTFEVRLPMTTGRGSVPDALEDSAPPPRH